MSAFPFAIERESVKLAEHILPGVSQNKNFSAYNKLRKGIPSGMPGKGIIMCRLIGYTLFWIAVGMVVGLFIESILVSIIVILFLVLLGYNLFVCCKK